MSSEDTNSEHRGPSTGMSSPVLWSMNRVALLAELQEYEIEPQPTWVVAEFREMVREQQEARNLLHQAPPVDRRGPAMPGHAPGEADQGRADQIDQGRQGSAGGHGRELRALPGLGISAGSRGLPRLGGAGSTGQPKPLRGFGAASLMVDGSQADQGGEEQDPRAAARRPGEGCDCASTSEQSSQHVEVERSVGSQLNGYPEDQSSTSPGGRGGDKERNHSPDRGGRRGWKS